MKVVRRLGEKGQVTIPAEIRSVMHINLGDFVEFDIVAVHSPKPKAAPRRSAKPAHRPNHPQKAHS